MVCLSFSDIKFHSKSCLAKALRKRKKVTTVRTRKCSNGLFSGHDLGIAALETPKFKSMEVWSAFPWLVPRLPPECSRVGRSHCWECSAIISELSNDWDSANVVARACFVSKVFCTESRQTGQVDCFLSHISMQERWKLWPQFGMILRTSLSWYSAKHIVHLHFKRN